MFPQAVIGGFSLITTGITNACAKNTLETSELGVRPPKSAQPEGRSFVFYLCRFGIERKYGRRDLAVGFGEWFRESCHHGPTCDRSKNDQSNFHAAENILTQMKIYSS